MSATDPLITYLAAHNVPCPGCGYNLRGLVSQECPECARQLVLQEIEESQNHRSPRMANTLAIMMAAPYPVFAIFFVWVAIGYNMDHIWVIASVVLLTCSLIGGLMFFLVRCMLKRNLKWIFLLNPISLVIAPGLVAKVLFLMFQ